MTAQTQTATAERGRECEVEMKPDYAGTLVGSWCGAAGGDVDVLGARTRSWGGGFIPLAGSGEPSIHPNKERAAGYGE